MKLHRAFRSLNDFNYSAAQKDGETWTGDREHCLGRNKEKWRKGKKSFNQHSFIGNHLPFSFSSAWFHTDLSGRVSTLPARVHSSSTSLFSRFQNRNRRKTQNRHLICPWESCEMDIVTHSSLFTFHKYYVSCQATPTICRQNKR